MSLRSQVERLKREAATLGVDNDPIGRMTDAERRAELAAAFERLLTPDGEVRPDLSPADRETALEFRAGLMRAMAEQQARQGPPAGPWDVPPPAWQTAPENADVVPDHIITTSGRVAVELD